MNPATENPPAEAEVDVRELKERVDWIMRTVWYDRLPLETLYAMREKQA